MNKPRLAKPFVFIGILNFTLYGAIVLFIGGTAEYATADKYFVSNHGHLTEVSETIYNYSKIHGYSLIITFTLLAMGIFVSDVRRWK